MTVECVVSRGTWDGDMIVSRFTPDSGNHVAQESAIEAVELNHFT